MYIQYIWWKSDLSNENSTWWNSLFICNLPSYSALIRFILSLIFSSDSWNNNKHFLSIKIKSNSKSLSWKLSKNFSHQRSPTVRIVKAFLSYYRDIVNVNISKWVSVRALLLRYVFILQSKLEIIFFNWMNNLYFIIDYSASPSCCTKCVHLGVCEARLVKSFTGGTWTFHRCRYFKVQQMFSTRMKLN